MKETDCRGWVLLELMTAVVMLAILTGTLSQGILSVCQRGTALEKVADCLGSVDSECAESWSWAAALITLSWDSGPTLRLRLMGGRNASTYFFGLWANGWLMTEANATEGGDAILGPNQWVDRVGQELVIRARSKDGLWGPPWRTVVPDVTGIVPVQSGDISADVGAGEIVIHLPVAANPEILLVPTGAVALPGPSGAPFFLSPPPSGLSGIEMDGVSQSWLSESRRSLDVYF